MPKIYSTEEMVVGLIPILRESSMVKGSPLNSWEQGFVLRLKHAREQGRLPQATKSDKVVDILDRLHAKHCRGNDGS